MRRLLSECAVALAAGALMLFGPAVGTGNAQYFGRNKVQYEKFKFEVLKTEHFDIYHYPNEQAVVEQTARMAERWYSRLSKLLDHKLSGRQVIILYASHPDFEQTNAIPGEQNEATGGVTEVFKRRIVLPLAGPLGETDHVLGHELVHAFQFDITGQGRSVATGNFPGALRLPLWFTEGMAEYLSLGPVDANTAMWMRDAARDTLPSLRQLGNDYKYFPYRWGQAFWAYVAGRWGDEVVGRLLRRGAVNGDLTRTFERTLGVHDTTLSRDWQQALNSAYDPLVAVTKKPSDYGRLLLGKGAKDGGRINIAPALSPDGKTVAFISERDLFSIEMFLANVQTGEVTRKIVKTSSDPHYESLQFIYSAGAWSPDGGSFVFAGVVKGHPVLRILGLEKGEIDREIPFEDIGEIYNPTWSPDGRYIAFTALAGGAMDLFSYDLKENKTRRLTNDFYAELHPAWSPDGRSIAFSTDRFSSDLRRLEMGNFRLALLDVSSGAIEPIPGADEGKNINPQWAPDGKGLYFVSDRTGIPNIYRVEMPAGPLASTASTVPPKPEVSQVTDLYVGISGITALSPVISVAKETGKIAFTAYDKGYHSIYVVDSADVAVGKPPRGPFPQGSPAVLPPSNRSRQGIVQALADHVTGLPDAQVFSQVDYHSHISLDYVAQPYLSGGVDSWGAFVGGGASAYWSDMLGEHNLATVLQVNGTLQDILGAVIYQNLSHRLNWGVAVQQIPYVIGGFAQGLIQEPNGDLTIVQQLQRFRQTSRELLLMTSYPFNRAQRVELSAGVGNIAFSGDIRTKTFDYLTGQQLSDDKISLQKCSSGTATTGLCLPDGLSFVQASTALVYDNSLFGATSPILGQRYRVDVTPRLGSLNMVEASVDYRRYFMPVRPLTIAARLLHYGRYGPGGEDNRLRPLFIGYSTLIRGYNSGSFDATTECPPSSFDINGQLVGACPQFDRLLGSRVAVGNLEMRFPLLGLLGLGSGYYGAFPIEMFFFGDAGMAWNSGSTLRFSDSNGGCDDGTYRCPVYSAGAGWRINLFGFAVIEMDLVKPFSRPNKSWYLQFGFAPGY